MQEDTQWKSLIQLVQKHQKHLFPSVTLAQLMLESGYRPGSSLSTLAKDYYNLFGIKAGNWKGKVISLNTLEDDGQGNLYQIKGDFRWYDNFEEAIIDYNQLFTSSPWLSQHYKNVLQAQTPKAQCLALQGTYATDTQYANKLIQLIKQYNLTQYDTPPQGKIKRNESVSLAQVILNHARNYLGTTKGSSKHLEIIQGYNREKPLPVGYAVNVGDDWCDIFVSFIGIISGAKELIGHECGVERHKRLFQTMGIWLGLIKPKAGDIVIFRWDGRLDGVADHIGFVESVSDGYIETIEGNTFIAGQSVVGRRKYLWNQKCIQGYARPKYPKVAVEGQKLVEEKKKIDDAIVESIIRGDWGDGQERITRLERAGYSAKEVQRQVNQRLQAKPLPKQVRVKESAKYWQTGEKISPWVKGRSFDVVQTKKVKVPHSQNAYLLSRLDIPIGWLLEEDVTCV